jgi:hypothetical protein|tara:strand:- start:521 stop:682 length:162 start_codon:yes stop_codon:yes gene_type:complete
MVMTRRKKRTVNRLPTIRRGDTTTREIQGNREIPGFRALQTHKEVFLQRKSVL